MRGPHCQGFPFSWALWNSVRGRDGWVQNAQQEEALVILLRTIQSHLAHSQIHNLRQGSGSVLCQQLLKAGHLRMRAALLIPG